ncbi:MAG: Mur ligase family protein [Fodinibius sp.]|nr:Mur ligase family protein [Fodinibius sp.]
MSACWKFRIRDRSLVGLAGTAFEGNPAEKLTIDRDHRHQRQDRLLPPWPIRHCSSWGPRPSLLGTVAKRIGNQELESRLTTADPIELAADMAQMVEAGSTHLVMEVSSHALDQGRVDGVEFDIAAFTNLSHDHLDYHDNFKSYAASKKKLFDGLAPQATAIINGDDKKASFIAMDCPANIVDFSFNKALDVDCQVLSNTVDGLGACVFQNR